MTLWFDLETTGLDVDKDVILEVGAVLCDLEQTAVAEFSAAVMPSGGMEAAHRAANETVRQMHWKSGLWQEVLLEGSPLSVVGDQLVEFLIRNAGPVEQVVLAGSGVAHFDRRVIRRHMPYLERRLYYKERDVSPVRWLLDDAGLVIPPRPDAVPHRALSDALDARHQWLWALAYLRGEL